MKNKTVFDYPIAVVYQAIAQLVVDNANAHLKNKVTLAGLAKIDYQYTTETNMGPFKNYVKMVEVVPDEKIAYTIHREKMEKYLVEYQLTKESDTKTRLDYRYELETTKQSLSLNHALVSLLYKRGQVKKFKAMCEYLRAQCAKIVEGAHEEG